MRSELRSCVQQEKGTALMGVEVPLPPETFHFPRTSWSVFVTRCGWALLVSVAQMHLRTEPCIL